MTNRTDTPQDQKHLKHPQQDAVTDALEEVQFLSRRDEINEALEAALVYFQERYDVVDGEYGPRPNREMKLGHLIEHALGRRSTP